MHRAPGASEKGRRPCRSSHVTLGCIDDSTSLAPYAPWVGASLRLRRPQLPQACRRSRGLDYVFHSLASFCWSDASCLSLGAGDVVEVQIDAFGCIRNIIQFWQYVKKNPRSDNIIMKNYHRNSMKRIKFSNREVQIIMCADLFFSGQETVEAYQLNSSGERVSCLEGKR